MSWFKPNRGIFADQYTRVPAETVFPDSAPVKGMKGAGG